MLSLRCFNEQGECVHEETNERTAPGIFPRSGSVDKKLSLCCIPVMTAG